jgi:hypothetical protein
VGYILLPLGFIATAVLYYDNSSWHPKFFIGMSACALWFSVALAKKFHWSVVAPVFLTLASAIWLSESRLHQYTHLTGADQVAIRELAARGGLCLLLIVAVLSTMWRRHYTILASTLGVFCGANSLFVLYEVITGERAFDRGGLLGNASMNGCSIAFTLPFLLWRGDKEWFPILQPFHKFLPRALLYSLPFLALIATESNMAIATGAVVVSAYVWSRYRVKYVSIAGLGLTVSLLVYLHHNHTIQALTSGRWRIWKGVMGYWWDRGEIWFGSGTGTAQALIPYIQGKLNIDTAGHLYLWLHSDVLQVLFEQGITGALSYTILVWYVLKKSVPYPYLFAANVGWIFTAAGNYPARMMVQAFIGAFLVAYTLRGNKYGPKF